MNVVPGSSRNVTKHKTRRIVAVAKARNPATATAATGCETTDDGAYDTGMGRWPRNGEMARSQPPQANSLRAISLCRGSQVSPPRPVLDAPKEDAGVKPESVSRSVPTFTTVVISRAFDHPRDTPVRTTGVEACQRGWFRRLCDYPSQALRHPTSGPPTGQTPHGGQSWQAGNTGDCSHMRPGFPGIRGRGRRAGLHEPRPG
jgi:hypothetical protein